MSGRGKPGGGLVRSHKSEDVKVTLNLRTTTSANLLALDDNSSRERAEPVFIQVHASVKYCTHPDLPVTLSTFRTALERQDSQSSEQPGDQTSSPVWINSALTPLRSTSDSTKQGGPPALSHIIHRRGGYARNILESWDFLTIPAKGEVVVKHLLPREGLRFRNISNHEEVKPAKGEKFVIGPSEQSLGTFWWRWGDLKGDLADKKFRADNWVDGDKNQGFEGKGNGDSWVESEGENGFGLTMEVENEAEIEIV